jgi:uncharacterized protein (TIGR02453 family)
MATPYFTPELFKFLAELQENNNREWFAANKQRYEQHARDPFLRFIADFAPMLQEISPHFVADPSPTGGSLFRIYRDTRFSADKSPYKTHMAAHFSHANSSKEVSAPGYYVSLSAEGCYGGAGLWRPDPQTLGKVRDAIIRDPKAWSNVRGLVSDEGERLSRPPKGYDPAHPHIEDLKRKDFVAGAPFTEEEVTVPDFLGVYTASCKRVSPLVAYLTNAVGMPW